MAGFKRACRYVSGAALIYTLYNILPIFPLMAKNIHAYKNSTELIMIQDTGKILNEIDNAKRNNRIAPELTDLFDSNYASLRKFRDSLENHPNTRMLRAKISDRTDMIYVNFEYGLCSLALAVFAYSLGREKRPKF